MPATLYAKKLTMHQEFVAGRRVPVTSLKVPTHTILGWRTPEIDGYKALIIGLGQTDKPGKKSLLGFLKKQEIAFLPQKIKEIKLTTDETVEGKTLNPETILLPQSQVNVTARSKGKGFAGVVKRHGFAGGPRTHGQSDRLRAPGSIGRGTTPGRIVKGHRMAGHLGHANVTIKNLIVLGYDAATSILKLKGAVPGAKNALVTLKITKIPKAE